MENLQYGARMPTFTITKQFKALGASLKTLPVIYGYAVVDSSETLNIDGLERDVHLHQNAILYVSGKASM